MFDKKMYMSNRQDTLKLAKLSMNGDWRVFNLPFLASNLISFKIRNTASAFEFMRNALHQVIVS